MKFLELHNEELIGKRRIMKWAGHVGGMGEKRGVYRVLVGKPERKRPVGEIGVDGRIILKCIVKKCDVGSGMDRAASG